MRFFFAPFPVSCPVARSVVSELYQFPVSVEASAGVAARQTGTSSLNTSGSLPVQAVSQVHQR